MARFKYVGEDARLYPGLGVAVDPANEETLTHDFEAAPDQRWVPLDNEAAAAPAAATPATGAPAPEGEGK